MKLLDQLAADPVLDAAYAWLCQARRRFPPNADIWWLRQRWAVEKPRLQAQLKSGQYRFDCLYGAWLPEVGAVDIWGARDALVQKALAEVLAPWLPVAATCTHLKGHGGGKATVRAIRDALPQARFVFRTDVRAYYASIDQDLLMQRLAQALPEPMPLLYQYLRRTSARGGLYVQFTRGIAMGSSLSPLLGAFFLSGLDRAMESLPVFYRRYMDDIIVLAASRPKLRAAIRTVQRGLAADGLATAPEKTWIGRVERGFDFLGYHFDPAAALSVSAAVRQHFLLRAARLYEQGRGSPSGRARFGQYVKR